MLHRTARLREKLQNDIRARSEEPPQAVVFTR